jgi:hypothetical protein
VIRVLASCFVVGVLGFGPWAVAADLPLLQTSEFKADQDSPAAAQSSDAKIELVMTLDSFVANADGPKMEGSSSMIDELKLERTEAVTNPEMQVTISGFMVKTAPSVARIDLQIGDVKRSFVWARDEVKSGRYELSFSEPMPGGRVPAVLPVSALAFVTRDAPSSVVMVTLETIKISIGSTRVADSEIQGEVTGIWPDLAP